MVNKTACMFTNTICYFDQEVFAEAYIDGTPLFEIYKDGAYQTCVRSCGCCICRLDDAVTWPIEVATGSFRALTLEQSQQLYSLQQPQTLQIHPSSLKQLATASPLAL